MARVERISSTTPVTVEQAQLIDPSGFRFISTEGFQQVGGVLAELGRRKLEAKNSLAVNAAVESRRLAKLRMQEFIKNNPDPDTWRNGLLGIIQEQGAAYSQQRFNAETQKEQEIEQQAFKDQLGLEVEIAAVNQNIENDIAISGKNVIDAISTDDGTPDAADEIDKQIKLLQDALERKYEPKVAAIHLEETLKEAKKAFYIDQSKLVPDATIAKIEKKKKALGKAGKDKEGLGAKDYDDIIASAYTAKALAEKSLDTLQEADRDKLGQALEDGTIDYTMINGTSLDEEEQESYRLKMNTEAERKAKGVPITTDQLRKGNLEAMAYDISTGAVTMPEFAKVLNEARWPAKNSPAINDDTYDELKSLAERRFDSYQAKAMKEREVHALGQLVTLPSEEAYAEMWARLTSKFEKEQAQTLRQLQFDNLDQYKKALRDWLKKPENKDANADEIYKQGRALLAHYRKSPDELRNPVGGKAVIKAFRETVAQAEIDKYLKPRKKPTGEDIIGTLEGTPDQRKAIDAVVKKRITTEAKQALIRQILNNERIRVKDNAGRIGTIPVNQLVDWLAISGNTLAVEDRKK